MKKKIFQSLKSRIVLVTTSFSFFVIIVLSIVSLTFFQTYARKNVIQSTEFNLQLVTGLMVQDMASLDILSKWCFLNSQIIDYLEDDTNNSLITLTTYNRLKEEFYNNRANTFVKRLIITDDRHSKMLQVGNSVSTSDKPVTTYDMKKIIDFSSDKAQIWPAIEKDPFGSGKILTIVRPIHKLAGGELLGYVYMSVNTDIITNQLKSYQILADSNLYLTLNDVTYKITNKEFTVMPFEIKSEGSFQGDSRNTHTIVGTEESPGGKKHIVVTWPSSISGMYLSHSLSQQLVSKQQFLYLHLLFILCGGIFILGILITLSLSRMINSPIKKLRKKIDRIGKGDFSFDPEIEWKNELGYIGHGINRLSQNVITLMESKLADEKEKQDLEYRMLQNQINPHFLYNTLGSIKWMAHIQGSSGIEQMTVSLSRLLKNIAKGTQHIISLKEEVELLKDYFLIQKYRYGGSITMDMYIPDEMMNNVIPRFTLQPIVENAIFHGIEPKGGAGTIQIGAACTEDGKFKITVKDDGVGISEESIKKIFNGEDNMPSDLFCQIGISNVHKRIQYNFGKEYGLSINSESGSYTQMILLLPFRQCGN